MSKERARSRKHFGTRQKPSRQPDRGQAFKQIQKQRQRRQTLSARAQNIGRTDISGTDFPDISAACQFGQYQAKRDGAKPISKCRSSYRGDPEVVDGTIPCYVVRAYAVCCLFSSRLHLSHGTDNSPI